MPTIKITDTFGFTGDVLPSPKGSLIKYFKSLPALALADLNLAQQGGGPLSKAPTKNAGVKFSETVDVGAPDSVDLQIKPQASGSIAITAPSTTAGKPATLFNPDVFADPITLGPTEHYVSASFNATVEVDATGKAPDLKFGFKASSGITLSYYQLFDTSQSDPTVAQAIESTLANYVIPGDLDDVEAMPVNSVAAVDGTGDLKFSGTVNVPTPTNAPVSLPLGPEGTVKVSAGGKISVGASYELTGEYQVRVQRLPGKVFHLGLYRKKGSEISLTASASGGVSASLGTNDLFGKILQVISSDPAPDKNALAGLPADEVAQIQKVIKSAVDRTLNLGVTLEADFASENDAMFLYEIDLGAITDAGRPLVHAALDGDLSSLVSADGNLPGITVLKTLISSSKTLRHSLKVNLLGIYNFMTVSELTLKGSQGYDATTGELILTDTATATGIGISAANFAADPKKLRKLLAEQFLISAVYKASGAIKAPPELHAQHSYFDLASNLARLDMRNDLLLGAAFQLTSAPTLLAKLPAGISHFGSTTVLAEVSYDDPAVEAVFLNKNAPRDPGEYERAGRDAIAYLVQQGDDNDYRLLTVTNDSLWADMKRIGDAASVEFSEAVAKYTQVPAAPHFIGEDYLDIRWWADSMLSCAGKLVGIRTFLSKNPGIDPNNHDFLALKRDLAKHLKDVAGKTREDFGGPWGLVAMCLLGSRVASVVPHLLISNKYVTVELQKSATARGQLVS